MNVLGLAAPFSHDASAALLVDGKIVAAAEEERFTRKKHEGRHPIHSIKYCLETANLKPSDIDYVAFPWSITPLRQRRVEHLFRSMHKKPSAAFKKFFRNFKELRERETFVEEMLLQTGFDLSEINIQWVEHQLAHAASAFYFSGMKEAAVLSLDAGGEITSTLLGHANSTGIRKVKEIVSTDSLGNFYATMTDYLGFDRGDGEYKVMGMAPFGDSHRCNLDHIIWWDEQKKTYRCNDDYIWVTRNRRSRMDKVYSKRMVNEIGPEREGDGLSEPYIHVAATTQRKLEEMTVKLVDHYLREDLERHGNLCFAGGCALNVALNRILLTLPYIKRLWVQPASHDAGTSLGAAAYVARQFGDRIEPMNHSYWGPQFSNEQIEEELKKWPYAYQKQEDISKTAAELLDQKHVVGWFQGRVEWGPRALGSRSILGNPTVKGTADKINEIIKFRETWRPFCPSILKEHAQELLGTDHPAPFMTIAFKINPAWKDRIPEVVHVDETCRPQIVEKETNPKYYNMLQYFYQKTNVPVVINTSLNRRGEPVVCTPKDALVMFEGSGLEYLAIGDYLVTKKS